MCWRNVTYKCHILTNKNACRVTDSENGYRTAAGGNLFRCAKIKQVPLSLSSKSWHFCNMDKNELLEQYKKGKIFSEVDLTGIDLSEAELKEIRIKNSNLIGANFSKTNLENSILRGSNLSNANLSGANLSNADLQGANLEGADLRSANLSGANFNNANLLNINIDNATFDAKTNLGKRPNGLSEESSELNIQEQLETKEDTIKQLTYKHRQIQQENQRLANEVQQINKEKDNLQRQVSEFEQNQDIQQQQLTELENSYRYHNGLLQNKNNTTNQELKNYRFYAQKIEKISRVFPSSWQINPTRLIKILPWLLLTMPVLIFLVLVGLVIFLYQYQQIQGLTSELKGKQEKYKAVLQVQITQKLETEWKTKLGDTEKQYQGTLDSTIKERDSYRRIVEEITQEKNNISQQLTDTEKQLGERTAERNTALNERDGYRQQLEQIQPSPPPLPSPP